MIPRTYRKTELLEVSTSSKDTKKALWVNSTKAQEKTHLISTISTEKDDFSDISEGSHSSDEDFVYYQEPEDQDDYEDPTPIEDFQWTKVDELPKGKWLPQYKPVSGPINLSLDQKSSPGSFFRCFFSDDTIDDIRLWTNQRAEITIDNTIRAKNKDKKWFAMRKEDHEMEAFLGCLIAMGVNRMANIKQYWCNDSRLFSNFGIKDLFCRRRFMDIFSNICLRKPGSEDPKDQLGKIRPLVTRIISVSQTLYTPKKELSIDEAMIAFSGRHKLVQFMPSKPVRYGFKAFLLCEAASGYVLNWRLYTHDPKKENFGATYRTVKTLCEGYEGEGNIIFMDRYYSGIQTIADLKKINFGACGTIQINRLHLDPDSRKAIESLEDRKIVYFKGPQSLLLTCWKDSRMVTLLSNYHGTDIVEVTRRIRKKDLVKLKEEKEEEKEEDPCDGEASCFTEIVSIPSSIADYNLFMRGVDLFDQKASYYSIQIRSKRWYLKILFHLIDIALINAHIIYTETYRRSNEKALDQIEFRKEVVRDLVSRLRLKLNIPFTEKKAPKKRRSGEVFPQLGDDECQLDLIPKIDGRKSTVKDCAIHRTQNQGQGSRQQTSYWCKSCEVAICPIKCYDIHRKSLQLKKVKLTYDF